MEEVLSSESISWSLSKARVHALISSFAEKLVDVILSLVMLLVLEPRIPCRHQFGLDLLTLVAHAACMVLNIIPYILHDPQHASKTPD